MKAKRFSEEQIIHILREAEQGDESIIDVCRKHAITDATFYRWRRKYGGLELADVHRLRELEKENARLKRIVAERDLEIDAMQELLSRKP